MKPKLCYVLPEYEAESHTHFSYLPEFVRRLSRDFDIFLVIERGRKPADNLGCSKVKFSGSGSTFTRLLKTELFLWQARFWGARNFYVHYSFFAAYTASWIALLTSGRVFYWNCGEPWKYRRPILRELFERLVYRMVDFLVTGTEGMKKQYAKHYHLPLEKIKVMPNWIEMRPQKSEYTRMTQITNQIRKELNISDSQKVILFVHRLSKRKGAHYLPEIIRRLTRNSTQTNAENILLIIGDGPERHNLELEIRNLKLEGLVRFLSWIPNEDLAHYYNLSDVLIMPSEEEGFPHVLLEAMAFGVPFAAFGVGGVYDIVPESAREFAVPAGDVQNLVRAVKKILSASASEISDLRAALKEHVKKFDIGNALLAFKEIISNS